MILLLLFVNSACIQAVYLLARLACNSQQECAKVQGLWLYVCTAHGTVQWQQLLKSDLFVVTGLLSTSNPSQHQAKSAADAPMGVSNRTATLE